MRIVKFLESPHVRILLFLHHHGLVRHKRLAKELSSRGTLSNVLNELLMDGLIIRYVKIENKPIQSFYSLTDLGREVATRLEEIINLLGISL